MGDLEDRVAALENELAEAKAELQAERQARMEFVSLVTHELRVPMTSIKGYTDLLLKGIMGPINEAQTTFLNTIRTNVERMSRMIADLSDINKVNGRAVKLSLEPVELDAVIREAVAAVRARLDEKGQTIDAELPDGVPPVRGDHTRLFFVFQRLLENAVQYTPDGGRIQVDAGTGETGDVQVTVQDTGIGIPAEEQSHIGEMFFRASDEKTRESVGNGLSLHLCQKLITLHGGSLTFTSTRDVGTTFTVTLPTAAG